MKKRVFTIFMMLALLLSLCSCTRITTVIPFGQFAQKTDKVVQTPNTENKTEESKPQKDEPAEEPEDEPEEETATPDAVPNPAPAPAPAPEPELDLKPAPFPDIVPEQSDFVFAESSMRLITQDEAIKRFAELATAYSPSGSPAQDAVNEIYARNGYTFTTQKILEYYQSKSWYTPRDDFSESDLSEIEKANIALFQSLK